jgi:putative sterol carrier protein
MTSSAREFFETLEARVDPAKTAGITRSFLFDIKGAGQWKVDVDDGRVTVSEGSGDADITISASEENFFKVQRRELSAPTAVMTRKMKFKGNIAAAMDLYKFL